MSDKKQPATSGKKIKVTLVKGLRGTIHKHRESVRGLGLRHREHTVEVIDTPAVRGMINKVSYLVKVEE
jgi:large subunit ribosomal protein L30